MNGHRRPSLLSPINSLEGAERVVAAGADEVYCEVTIPGLKNLVLYRNALCNIQTYDELDKVVSVCHKEGAKLILVANFPFVSKRFEKQFAIHLSKCIDAGVDGLIVGNLGVLSMIKQLGVNLPLYASTFLCTMNYEAANYLSELGFSRIILERHLSIEEISQIVKSSLAEIEVFIHGGGCSNINGSCYLLHRTLPELLEALTRVEGFNPPCRLHFNVYDGQTGEFLKTTQILDAYVFCSLCRLPELMKIGVSGFKIVDRCLSARYQETMTRIYRQIIDLLEKGEIEAYEDALEAAKDIDMGLSPFFPQTIRKMCCEYQRCYYGPFYHVHRKVREVPG